jgi:hypothetical protein
MKGIDGLQWLILLSAIGYCWYWQYNSESESKCKEYKGAKWLLITFTVVVVGIRIIYIKMTE